MYSTVFSIQRSLHTILASRALLHIRHVAKDETEILSGTVNREGNILNFASNSNISDALSLNLHAPDLFLPSGAQSTYADEVDV